MAETHDTIKSLLAEFRGYSAFMPPSYHVTMSWHDFLKMLDRFEAAHDHDVDTATDAASRSVVGACAKLQEAERKCVALREALARCREIALQWQADEAAGVAGTTDKPRARSAAEAVIDMELEINAALAATEKEGGANG